jgi:hypothetical protein
MLAMCVAPARFRLLPVASTPAVTWALALPERALVLQNRLTAERQVRAAVVHQARLRASTCSHRHGDKCSNGDDSPHETNVAGSQNARKFARLPGRCRRLNALVAELISLSAGLWPR